jgi:hypothetical protein
MRTYKLETPKDAHGQPIRLFKANLENNVSKAIDQLTGICAGILADGKVNEKEAVFFADWVRKFAPYEPIWPFTDILTRVDRIFADGRCDKEELEELKSLMEELCGQNKDAKPKETYSTTLPLDSPKPDPVVLVDRIVNITGRFAFGTRKKVMTAIEEEGGIPSGSTPTKKSNYLVIGVFASRDWYNTNYGRKIERAVELRESKSGIAIISEEHWRKFVA